MVRPSCWRSSRIQRMIAFQRPRGLASTFLLANTQMSRQRSAPSRSASMPGTDRVKKAGGSRKSLALARSSRPPWSPRWVIGRRSRPGEAWQPGSVLFPSSIRQVARSGSARSQSRAIDICDGCSSPVPWQSSDTRDSMVRSGSGSRASWNVGRSRLLRLLSPTRSHAWPGL